LSIGNDNICSSVQDHRQYFSVSFSSIGSGRTNESNGINKKETWSIWRKEGLKKRAPEVMTSSEVHLIRSTFHQKHASSEAERIGASKGCSKDLISPHHCRRTKGWNNN